MVGTPEGTDEGTGDGAEVLHVPLSSQRPLRQSLSARQLEPGMHAGQVSPPQSTSVSSPSLTPFEQETDVGATEGEEPGEG